MAKVALGRHAALLFCVGLVAGCGFWPFDRREVRAPASGAGLVERVAGRPAVADGTALLPAVRLVAADRGRQGVILRADAIAPMQGFHSPELRPVGRSADGVEIVEVRAAPPLGAQPVGPERTRLLSVGRFYANRDMEAIRAFRMVTAGGSRDLPAP